MYELILLAAILVGVFTVRGQGKRLAALETELAGLRAMLADPARTGLQQPAVAGDPVQGADAEVVAATVEPATPADDLVSEEVPDEERDAAPDEPVVGPWQRAARAAVDEPAEAPAKRDIETALGTRWAVWVGGLALALGGVFLIRYSIEAGFFGPRMRLAAAALFGVLLGVGGEVARRRGFRAPVGGLDAAYVPAILTAASAFTLFATVFAAHALYGFIGSLLAFVLLGALALGTIALALVHGQALAGLGLLGSYLTPVLVASQAPSAWTLFAYLAIVLAASLAVASFRRWRFLAAAACAGAGLWSLLYLFEAPAPQGMPMVFMHLIGLASLGLLWLRPPQEESPVDVPSVLAGLFAAIVAAALASGGGGLAIEPLSATLLLSAMLALAAWRTGATPLLHAAGLALVAVAAGDIAPGGIDVDLYYGRFDLDLRLTAGAFDAFDPYAIALAVAFLAAGAAMAWLTVAQAPRRAASWAFWAAVAPFCQIAALWLVIGNLDIDLRFAAAGLALAIALAAAAEGVARREDPAHAGGLAITFLAAGSAAALAFALMPGFGPLTTTILTGLAAALPAAASRVRAWPVLGWLAAGFGVVTLARFGIDPTLVGAESLSTRPVFNQLLPGYGLPAVALAYAAWQLARTGTARARMAAEALAVVTALVGAGMLVRHAMNGGVITAGEPTLAEQAIYSLLLLGAGGALLALDRRSPSPVFLWGSIAAGVLSVISLLVIHLVVLNPYLTGESTGAIAVFNLLLLAYLLPAVAMAALAWRAHGRRPVWYVSMLAAGAGALGFAYATLSVRRWFHGEFIASWKGFGEVETYTYSAVWLVLGVALLVAGLRLGSRALRLASAALVVVAVAKVFLYDMRELEGVLRALSFIGLGGVLIGIGMFYQRMLVANAR